MVNVKKVFFLTEDEVKRLGDKYVVHDMPHYELDDGSILYTKKGAPSVYEHWVAKLDSK